MDIVSREECEVILSRYFGGGEFEIKEFTVVPLSDSVEGFLGEHYILKINVVRFEKDYNLSFFAKIPPVNFKLQIEYCRTSYSFEKEIFFYEELIKNFQKYCPTFCASILPKFYYSRSNELLVMENINLIGFQNSKSTDVADYNHLRLLLKTVAKLHSASLIFEEKKSEEIGKPFRLIDKYGKYMTEAFFQKDKNYLGYKWHIASLKGILSVIDIMDTLDVPKEEFKKRFVKLAERSFDIVEPSKRFRNVCCHGDLWLKNSMFRYENSFPSECKIIDFQLMKYNPPAFDVLKIIYQFTTAEMRKFYFEDLLNYYYDNVRMELTLAKLDPDKVFSRDEFYASIYYMLPQCKLETSYYHTFLKCGPVYMKKLMEIDENFQKFTFVDRSPWTLERYTDGSSYRYFIDEILFDVKDMLFNYGITREECFSILRSKFGSNDYNLLNYTVTPMEEKYGFLGDHFYIKTTVLYDNAKSTHSFFAKIIPNAGYNDFILKTGVFKNEQFMFDVVFRKMFELGIDEVYKSIPRCYYSRSNEIMVFEDLSQYGFFMANKHKPLEFDELSTAVKSLANVHGAILIYEELLSKDGKKFRVTDAYKNGIKEVNYSRDPSHLGYQAIASAVLGIYTMIDLFPDPHSSITDKQFKRSIKKIYENLIYDLTGPSEKYRNVICHSDLWSSNLMLKYDRSSKATECRIVDFQIVRFCPPAHDLMAIIYLNTSRKFRANFLNDIVQLYYEELTNIFKKRNINISKVVPFKEFQESCEEYKMFAVNQMVTLFPIVMLKSNDIEKYFEDKEFLEKTTFVDRSDFIRKKCEQDEDYKYILGECIKDLRILCENMVENGQH